MRAVNHVAAGAVIVASISNPLVSLPLAFLAHFALDALPHSGDVKENESRQLVLQRYILPVDILAGLLLLLAIVLWYPENPWLVAFGGVLCASPDLGHLPRFVRFLRTGKAMPPTDRISRFHTAIQWCERPWGYFVEIPFLAVMVYLLFANT